MTAPFLTNAMRDRECLQSKFVKVYSGFTFNQELSANAVDNSLIPIKKTVGTLYFWQSFAQLKKLYILQFADHRLRIVAKWVVAVVLLQVGLKCFSMRMTFDLIDELLNSEMFCLHVTNPETLKSMSSSSTLVDSCPPAGLSVLVECLMSS